MSVMKQTSLRRNNGDLGGIAVDGEDIPVVVGMEDGEEGGEVGIGADVIHGIGVAMVAAGGKVTE